MRRKNSDFPHKNALIMKNTLCNCDKPLVNDNNNNIYAEPYTLIQNEKELCSRR